MTTSALDRARHVKERIQLIRAMLGGLTFDSARSDMMRWAALERHLEIVSEASRNIPGDWRAEFGADIPWSKVAGLGSLLRHAYQHASQVILWDIYRYDLDPLEAAIDRMLAAHGDAG